MPPDNSFSVTLVCRVADLDQNEFFFWLPEAERAKMETGSNK